MRVNTHHLCHMLCCLFKQIKEDGRPVSLVENQTEVAIKASFDFTNLFCLLHFSFSSIMQNFPECEVLCSLLPFSLQCNIWFVRPSSSSKSYTNCCSAVFCNGMVVKEGALFVKMQFKLLTSFIKFKTEKKPRLFLSFDKRYKSLKKC